MDFINKILDVNYQFPRPGPPTSDQVPLGQYYEAFIGWKVPILTSAAYYLIVTIWKSQLPAGKPAKSVPMSLPFKLFVLLHNLALFVFSLATFVAVTPRAMVNYRTRDLLTAVSVFEDLN